MFADTLPSDAASLARGVPRGSENLSRSSGALDLHFHHGDGVTRAGRVFQSGMMRARFPNVAQGLPPEAVLVNTAGGLTGGDRVVVGVRLGSAARAVITTQAHEKIYRSFQGSVSMTADIVMEGEAALDWLPQPTILFEGARLDRKTHIVMTEESAFLGVEAVIFGRTAMGEVMRSGALDDRWTILRQGRLVHADRFFVAGDIADMLGRPATLAGALAMATIRYVAPDAQARLGQMRAFLDEDGAASAWNGLLLARIVAANGYLLGRRLAQLLTGFRGRALPSVWHI